MAEQPATNPNRPAIHRVSAGSIIKGSRVEILGTTDQKPLSALRPTDRVAVREFTEEEAAEYDRTIRLKVAEHQVKYLREQILTKMESIVKGLERATEEVRRAAAQSERYDLASSVYRVQSDLA